jgi:hypothetical protein
MRLHTPKRYIGMAWDHVKKAWWSIVAAAVSLGWAALALLEFVLHVLRIPHWHP